MPKGPPRRNRFKVPLARKNTKSYIVSCAIIKAVKQGNFFHGTMLRIAEEKRVSRELVRLVRNYLISNGIIPNEPLRYERPSRIRRLLPGIASGKRIVARGEIIAAAKRIGENPRYIHSMRAKDRRALRKQRISVPPSGLRAPSMKLGTQRARIRRALWTAFMDGRLGKYGALTQIATELGVDRVVLSAEKNQMDHEKIFKKRKKTKAGQP